MDSSNQTSYVHKKFAAHKRKRDVDQLPEGNISSAAPPSKRRQLKGLFRPWQDNEPSSEESSKQVATQQQNISSYHANMVRQRPHQRSPKEQQRRDRNTLACLLSRRAKQAQEAQLAQQYEQYRQRQAAIMEQQVRYSLYYRQLLQQAVFQQAVAMPSLQLPQQQQQFLQQMALSQQLLIFGTQH